MQTKEKLSNNNEQSFLKELTELSNKYQLSILLDMEGKLRISELPKEDYYNTQYCINKNDCLEIQYCIE